MIFKSFRRRVYIHIFQQFVGFARFSYMKDLKSQSRKSQVRSLKEKLEREEQKVNCKIGTWGRQKTNVDSFQDF